MSAPPKPKMRPKLRARSKQKVPVKRKGVSPILNEQMVLDYLTAPADPNSVAPLQSASMLAIVDMHDRQIARPEFVTGTSNALALHTAMGRLDTLMSIKARLSGHVPEDPVVLIGLIDNAIKGLCSHAEAKRTELRSIIKMVVQMPTAEDSIN